MQGQKSHSSKLFLLKNIFVVGAGFLISFFSLNFNTNEASALYTPTLSASVDQTTASVNGNQVMNSTNKTTEIPLNLIVNTNNKTGYTATLNSETDETALVNNDSSTNARINSISSAGLLGDFSNNTWGVKAGGNTNFSPIPKPTSPMSVIQTTSKTNGNEANSIKIGMKLSDNLESGRYTNKLVFSILTNNYDHIAIMTEGPDFNEKLKALETATNKIEHFKKSTVAPATSMDAVNVEDEESDYEIKLWLDPTDKTAYYYAESEKVYLNTDSSRMFFSKIVGQKIRNVSFISNRAGKRFSLKHESEGIRKIISMLGFLVEVYNKENIIAVIDELDAGVFEYLLGELIEIFSESAKGQLIFTSHNLRVLEKLPPYKVVFSTASPTNRYIRLTGIKPSNNLRDIYLRGIQLGGHEEELYQGVSNSKIKRALRKAGIKLGE